MLLSPLLQNAFRTLRLLTSLQISDRHFLHNIMKELVLARYGPKGKRYNTMRYHTKYRDTIQYNTMHKCNDKFNALQHRRQFIKEHLLLLQRLRVWPVQQDDDRSETADMGTCADDLKRGRGQQ